jgi:hypothetical protein
MLTCSPGRRANPALSSELSRLLQHDFNPGSSLGALLLVSGTQKIKHAGQHSQMNESNPVCLPVCLPNIERLKWNVPLVNTNAIWSNFFQVPFHPGVHMHSRPLTMGRTCQGHEFQITSLRLVMDRKWVRGSCVANSSRNGTKMSIFKVVIELCFFFFQGFLWS